MKLNMFFEGIFLIIDDHGVRSGVAESCYIWDEYIKLCGARGGVVVKALRYKPAGRGSDSR
jgi:hypothetical protein